MGRARRSVGVAFQQYGHAGESASIWLLCEQKGNSVYFCDNYYYYLYNITVLLDSSKGELIGLLQA